jgi:hypothetical protein
VIQVDQRKFHIGTDEEYPTDGVFTDMTVIEEVRRSYMIEQRRKTGIYQNPFKIELINSFTPSGMKLFLWIVLNLKSNEDSIEINHSKVGKALKFSSTKTFYNAIANLTELEIISKKASSEYWINPFYIFNGNKIKYYKTHDKVNIVHTKTV